MAIFKKGITQAQKTKSIIIIIVMAVLFSIPIYNIGKKLLSYTTSKGSFSKNYPILKCELIEDEQSKGSRVHNLNETDRYTVVKFNQTDIEWITAQYHDGKPVRLEHTTNRQTGSYMILMKFQNGQEFTFWGKCESGSLKKKF